MSSTIIFALMLDTFAAVLVFAYLDMRNTQRAIRRHETSSATVRGVGPQTQGVVTAPH